MAEELTECQQVPKNFSMQILEDLAKDEEALVSNGFKIEESQQTADQAVSCPAKQTTMSQDVLVEAMEA